MSRSRYIADFVVSSNDIANGTITFSDIGTVFTSNLIESGDTTSGNVYFTNARVDARIATTSINALSDVDVTGASPSQTLIWNGSTWTPGSPIVGSTEFSNSAVIANLANVANIANMVATISNFTTTNLREGSNLYFTNARVDARVATTSINALSDVDITGITTNQVLSWNGTAFVPTSIASSGFANVANLANMVATISNFTTTNLAEGSNLYYTNTRVYSNVINTLQNYTGNITAGNITITGKFFGDGSALTGIGSGSGNVSLAGMATYKGNILAANITAQTIVASNITVGNVLSPTGSLLRFTNNTNTIINAGVFDSIFSDTGNVILPNVVIVGKIFGDGSALTGVSGSGGAANLTTLPVYNGNILAANITAQTVTATNVYANSFISTGVGTPTIQSGTNINLTANNAVVITNSVLRLRSYSTTDRNANITPQEGDIIYNSTDDVLQFYANGSWVSASGSSAVAGFANVANIANMVSTISNFSTTNLGEGTNLYYTNSRVYSNVINLLSTYTGNINAGNVIVTGKFVGDGSGLTGVTGSANLTTLPTYNGNALISNLVVTSNATIVGNIQANYFIGNGALLTGITAGGGASLSGMATYNGNILAAQVVVTGNVSVGGTFSLGNITTFTGTNDNNTIIRAGTTDYTFTDAGRATLGNILVSNIYTMLGADLITASSDSNVRIKAGLFASLFSDDGNVTLPNLVVTGGIYGSAVGLTGVPAAALSGMATYNGNILASNITARTVTANSFVGNLTSTTGAILLRTSTDNNTTIQAGSYQSIFRDNGNVELPNIVLGGKIYGDGSGLTGVSASLAGMATYNGNILAANIITGTIRASNLTVGNVISLNGCVVVRLATDSNTYIQTGPFTSSFLDNGNVLLPNVILGGKIFGDGSALTGITANLSSIATYTGNILAANITATSITTTNLFVSNIITPTGGTALSVTSSQNTTIRHGAYLSQFLSSGNVLLPNVVLSGKIFGDGSALTNISASASLAGMATYNANILAAQVVVTGNVSVGGSLNIGNITSFAGTNDNNTIIRSGTTDFTFSDQGYALLGNIRIANIYSLSGGDLLTSTGGTNSIIKSGTYSYTFSDTGIFNVPNLTVSGNISFGANNATVLEYTNDTNTIIRAGTTNYYFNDGGLATFPSLALTGNLVNSTGSVLVQPSSTNNTTIKAGACNFVFTDVGFFGVNTTNPTEHAHIVGNVLVTGGIYITSDANTNPYISSYSSGSGTRTTYIGNQSITTSSDIRLKENVANTVVNAVNVVNNLRVVDFTWNDPSDRSFNNKNARGVWTGLIAQEVINQVPYVVNAVRDQENLLPIFNSDEYWTLEYDKLVPLLIKAVQEQQIMINDLQARITALESNK